MIKVSVIVPVYNVEQYIERCARSLMEQTMKEGIEFIFINDCTPDGSMEVLQRVIAEYPERKNQIRLINHSTNRGIAYTRGEGIREAKGKYIGWCDSDDWCEPSMFEKMYEATSDATIDVVTCGLYRHLNNGCIIQDDNVKASTPIEYMTEIYKFHERPFFAYPVTKLIKRSVFINNDVFPYEGINRTEDLGILIRCFCHMKTIGAVNESLYHYDQTNQYSITHSTKYDKKDLSEQLFVINKLTDYLKNLKVHNWRTISHYLQYNTKCLLKSAFDNDKEFFMTYRGSHKSILKFSVIPLKHRITTWVVYSNYYIYKLYNFIQRQ